MHSRLQAKSKPKESFMENSLKQRIVGAIVLIALAVIFLPSILKEKTNQAPFQSKIPPKPIASIETKLSEEVIKKNNETQASLDKLDEKLKRKTKQTTESTNTSSIDNSKDFSQEPTKTKAQETVKETIKTASNKKQINPTIGEQFKQAAWVIQIASFSSKENAVAFVDKLKKAGQKAYRRQVKNNKSQSIFRIFVGPYIKKNGAKKALVKVNKISSMSGIILPFDPVNH